jgi:hypothetical protein
MINAAREGEPSVALGSDTVFSLSGGMALHLNRAVAAHPRLKAVYDHPARTL